MSIKHLLILILFQYLYLVPYLKMACLSMYNAHALKPPCSVYCYSNVPFFQSLCQRVCTFYYILYFSYVLIFYAADVPRLFTQFCFTDIYLDIVCNILVKNIVLFFLHNTRSVTFCIIV